MTQTIRQSVRETIENYSEDYLMELVSNHQFIAIYPDGDVCEIDYETEAEDAEEMREKMLDFLGWFEDGFFDDEEDDSMMADIVSNYVCYEWGADPSLLESYEYKMSLLEYVKDYGVTELTPVNTDKYDWDTATRRLDLNRRFKGTIYKTCKWNSENPTFCVDWEPGDDSLCSGSIDIYELEDLLDDIGTQDVVFWNGSETVTLATDEEKSIVKEWLDKHDVSDYRKYNCSDECWKKLTEKLGLPASYDEVIYTTYAGSSCKPELAAAFTVLPAKQSNYRFGIALPDDLLTEYKEFYSDNQALEYGEHLRNNHNAVSVNVYREVRNGWIWIY